MSNDTPIYKTGADFWRDTAVRFGIEEAFGICGRYLGTQLKSELPDDEKQFCREPFTAMYEATAGKADPAKLVYPYDFQRADERLEASFYHDSRKRNNECAQAIDNAIHASCYKSFHYNLEVAAMSVVHTQGFARVMMVLAHQIQRSDWDGRYSNTNKSWSKGYALPEPVFGRAILNAHPILIEDFTKYVRKFYEEVGAERFLLPGRAESGEIVQGYEIVRSIAFDDRRGFAIGLNPFEVQPFVTWQFTTENGSKRDFYWGSYHDELSGAAENYVARVIVHMSGGDVWEIQNPLTAAEMSAEQNYNMIDGVRNNDKPQPDLDDGQRPEERPSVLKQIRDAQKAPKPPHKEKAPDRKKDISI